MIAKGFMSPVEFRVFRETGPTVHGEKSLEATRKRHTASSRESNPGRRGRLFSLLHHPILQRSGEIEKKMMKSDALIPREICTNPALS